MTERKTITEAQLAAAIKQAADFPAWTDEDARAIFAALPDSGLDVERLARAIENQDSHTCDDGFRNCAAAIAAAYARQPEPGEER